MQRLIDIAASTVLLLLLAPLLVLLAIALHFSGEGEIFFAQQRVGWHSHPFRLLKFATMLKNSPNIGTGAVTVKNDPRVLPIGRFLRQTKINELPQLLNILRGDMSFIGPRPQERRCFDAFPTDMRQMITRVRPGLSGIGSVVFRNEQEMMDGERDPDHIYDHVIMPYKGELERWYVENQSIGLYFKLVLATAWVVLLPDAGIVARLFPRLPSPSPAMARLLQKASKG